MNKVLKNSWALFLGMGLIMIAHGFQGSLLGVRAVNENIANIKQSEIDVLEKAKDLLKHE